MDQGFRGDLKMDKKCTKCKLVKSINCYYKDKSMSTGFHPWCKDCKTGKAKNNYHSDISKGRENGRKSYYKNREEILKRSRTYYSNNKERILQYNNVYEKSRINRDPVFKTAKTIKRLLRLTLTGKSNYTSKSLLYKVCGIPQFGLIHHLHSTFEFNYGLPRECIKLSDVEIDHIIPLSTAKTVEDARRLNHYTNLQLLFKEDNQAKGTKIIFDFLPNLV